MLPSQRFWRETVSLLDVMWPRSNRREGALLGKKNFQLYNNWHTLLFSFSWKCKTDNLWKYCSAEYLGQILGEYLISACRYLSEYYQLHIVHKTTGNLINRLLWWSHIAVQDLRSRSMGNPYLDFDIRISGFCNRTRNPKTDFTSEKSLLRLDFSWEVQIRISWISFLPFDWEIRKRIYKTVLVNSGLLFANYACACKTAVLKNSFSNPFADFPIER